MAQKSQVVEKRIKDPVSVIASFIQEMRIYRESLKKEHDHEIVYEDFKINQPRKVQFYAEKPNNNPFLLMKYKK